MIDEEKKIRKKKEDFRRSKEVLIPDVVAG